LQQLNVPTEEVEELLIGLILEGKVEGKIDQVGMRLELDRKYACIYCFSMPILLIDFMIIRQSLEKKRYAALEKWTVALEGVHAAVVGKTGGGRGGPEGSMGMGIMASESFSETQMWVR
jgi:COP9 signalosome complex subunit 2